jgi:hypothetical protein
MLLTLVVWVLMYLRRRSFVLANKISLRNIATPESLAQQLDEYARNPGNNFRNLCEIPLLFYALCGFLFINNRVDTAYVALSWVFFAFRVLHSYVQCSSNRVSRRLMFYALSSFAFWAMMLRAAFQFFF